MENTRPGICGLPARCIGVILGVVLFQAAAVSAPRVTVRTIYFSVRGTTASALYADVLRNGPRGKSGRAMATTEANITQDADFRRASRCRLKRYRLNVKITTRLPRLAEKKRISPALRRTWNGFVGYVRRHEATHKAIYLRCARKISAQARRVFNAAGSCRNARSALKRVFARELARCEARHAGYDRREAGRIKRLPLIVQAIRLRRSKAKSAHRTLPRARRGKHRRQVSRR